MWDVTFQTAVAQAELDARDYPGAYHRVAFHGRREVRSTSRPRGPNCRRVRGLDRPPGRRALPAVVRQHGRSPALRRRAAGPGAQAAEPDKGTGIAMCCTFGDLTDVTWWRELQLPARVIIGRDGRVLRDRPEWIADEAAWEAIAGKTTFSAREAVVEAATRVRRP